MQNIELFIPRQMSMKFSVSGNEFFMLKRRKKLGQTKSDRPCLWRVGRDQRAVVVAGQPPDRVCQQFGSENDG
jgi:hypothetical protein